MIRTLGSRLQNHLHNIPGKSIPKKVVVFESDDWGTIRIPSAQVYRELQREGLLDSNPYNRFDSLESSNDLELLLTTLSKFKDHRGNPPILTANFIVGNPDFERIATDKFERYHVEQFTDTYKHNSENASCMPLWQEASRKKLVHFQFHGREHVNALAWLKLLRARDKKALRAFHHGVFSIDLDRGVAGKRTNLMATLDYTTPEEREFGYQQLREGLNMFESVFGFRSKSFIAPCNVWDNGAEETLSQCGVRVVQSLRGRLIPRTTGYDVQVFKQGEFVRGLTHLVRNAYFEPATNSNYDWVGQCLRKVYAAFLWNKPAIISTHRLNYIGKLDERNRVTSTNLLNALISKLLERWPTLEFVTSEEAANLYANTCAE